MSTNADDKRTAHNATFKTKTGHNYRHAIKLDLDQVTKELEQQGYIVKHLDQWWRHIHGQVESNGHLYFFKMATSPGVSERTENEAAWNQQINSAIKQRHNWSFAVPKIISTGHINTNFYYLAEYLDATVIAQKDLQRVYDVQPWLTHIATITLDISRIIGLTLPRDQEFTVSSSRDHYLNKGQQWLEILDNPKLSSLFDLANTLPQKPWLSLNHGDFVPWHILNHPQNLYLIDGEHASTQTMFGYDIGYCYHRLYTTVQAPKLADKFLIEVKAAASDKEWHNLTQQLPQLLALRSIGGYMDMIQDQDPSQQPFHDQLKARLLAGTVLPK